MALTEKHVAAIERLASDLVKWEVTTVFYRTLLDLCTEWREKDAEMARLRGEVERLRERDIKIARLVSAAESAQGWMEMAAQASGCLYRDEFMRTADELCLACAALEPAAE